MLLLDQPALVEWSPPMTMRAPQRHQPNLPVRQRKNFETGRAAVEYVTATLPEECRSGAKIYFDGGPTFVWDDIKGMGKRTA